MTEKSNAKKDGFEYERTIIIPRNVISKQCIGNEIISNLYLTNIGLYPKALNHYRKRANGSEQHILIYCSDGKGSVTLENTTYHIEAGNYIIIPKKTAHVYQADLILPWTIYWFHFSGTGADALVAQLQNYKGYAGFTFG